MPYLHALGISRPTPDMAYDNALPRFIERILDPVASPRDLTAFAAVCEPLAALGPTSAGGA